MTSYTVQRHNPSGEAFALRYDDDNVITGAVHLDKFDLAIVQADPSTLENPDYDDPENPFDPDADWSPASWQYPLVEYP